MSDTKRKPAVKKRKKPTEKQLESLARGRAARAEKLANGTGGRRKTKTVPQRTYLSSASGRMIKASKRFDKAIGVSTSKLHTQPVAAEIAIEKSRIKTKKKGPSPSAEISPKQEEGIIDESASFINANSQFSEDMVECLNHIKKVGYDNAHSIRCVEVASDAYRHLSDIYKFYPKTVIGAQHLPDGTKEALRNSLLSLSSQLNRFTERLSTLI